MNKNPVHLLTQLRDSQQHFLNTYCVLHLIVLLNAGGG